LDDDDKWNRAGMNVGSIDGENIECVSSHLSTFTMVLLKADSTQVYCVNKNNPQIYLQ
jgi:hypothetical protein